MIPDPASRLFVRLRRPELRLGLGCGLPAGGPGNAPAASFNFLSGETLDSRITFTRGSSATRVNSSGLIETVSSGNPRFDYDPVTLAVRGLLIEEQRTNLLVRSSDYSTSWGPLTGISLTAGQASPDTGSTNATRVQCTTSGATRILTQTASVASGMVYVFSAYMKKGTTSYGVMALTDGTASTQALWTFDLNAGATAQNLITTIASTAGVIDAGNGWFRCWVRITSPDTSVQARAFPTNAANTANGATGDNIILFGAQLEAGSVVSSYIPTGASQVTRSADSASITGSAFISWFNPTEGAMLTEYSVPALSGNRAATYIRNGSDTNFIGTLIETSAPKSYVWNGSQQAGIANAAITANAPHRTAITYRMDDFAAVTDGGTVGTDTVGSVPTDLSQLDIGRGASHDWLNGHIRSLAYYARRLANADLQRLTA